MEENRIKNGDTVKLNSGGVIMTVNYVNTDGYGKSVNSITCCWIWEGQVREYNFPEYTLKKVDVNEETTNSADSSAF